MSDYPQMIAAPDQVAPVPRRVRGVFDGRTVFDTDNAIYVWEWPNYPQYYIPIDDIDESLLIDENHEQHLPRGTARRLALRSGDRERPRAARLFSEDAVPGLSGMVRFEWGALDAWYEEDEQIFVHPRNPYTRVDALRSSKTVRVELDGVVLAESSSPVLVFETGLPTRYYFDRGDVHFEHLRPTDTVSECPYKGTTGGYWSVEAAGAIHPDLAWTYNFPTRQLLPITGMIAFYDEKVDTFIDGQPRERPVTHFFPAPRESKAT